MSPPRVFVSYSHDSPEHAQAVLGLADRLRAQGIDARLDQYEVAPTQGWPGWMRQQLDQADLVVCVCTATYRERFEGRAPPGEGLGASWEGWLAEIAVYSSPQRAARFVPVLMAGGEVGHVPQILSQQSRFEAAEPGFHLLLRRLHGKPGAEMPPLGPMPTFAAVSPGMQAPPGPRDRVHALVDALEQAYVRRAPEDEVAKLLERLRAAKQADVVAHGLQAGDVLGRYRLLRRLGEGGFATVWAAWERLREGRGRRVALKLLHPQHASNATKKRRFVKGAADLLAVSDPGVVRGVVDCEEDGGRCWFTMELVEGGDLEQAIRAGVVGPVAAVRMCLLVGRTLHRLHEAGLIHRDVKPANVLLRHGQPLLSDFDLVRNLNLSSVSDSRVVGDALFTAPEQTGRGKVDRRADVYGLAMTALWCIARGELDDHFAWERELPEVPLADEVVQALWTGAELRAERRPESCAAWCDAVERALASAEAASRTVEVAPAAAPVGEAPAEVRSPGPPRTRAKEKPAAQATAELTPVAPRSPRPRRASVPALPSWAPALVPIPAGTFWMGSPDGEGGSDEHPRHEVRLTRPYAMGEAPVTQTQWRTVVERARAAPWASEEAGLADLSPTPSHHTEGPDAPQRPVDLVSWLEVVTWCNALSRLVGRQPVYHRTGDNIRWNHEADGFRLPTEAEWEHACRAGTETRWWCGDDEAGLAEVAWYDANAHGTTHPVAAKPANPWGLHDVHGNVREWCWDWFDSAAYASQAPEDPTGPPRGENCVLRGGCRWNTVSRCRSAYRNHGHPTSRFRGQGFRVVLSPPPSVEPRS